MSDTLSLIEMTKRSARDIIKRPIITEKSYGGLPDNQYTFEVDRRANKIEIRRAVEEIFKVNVLKVNTVKVAGKKRRFGRRVTTTSQWKKAVVTLKEGQKISLGGIEYFEQ